MNAVKKFLRGLMVRHYVVFALVLGIGVFNAVTALSPAMKQQKRERNIEKTFEKWWEEEGAAQFIVVGLKADEKTKAEEFEQFRERYLKQNHTFVVEDRIVEMKKEFREWWEIGGGKEQYIQEHKIYPDERHFKAECDAWIKKYTDKQPRYGLAFVPKYAEYDRLLTSWLLMPGILSFILFAAIFPFAFFRLAERWGIWVAAGLAALALLAGGVVVDALASTSFFDHYAVDRYMGASAAVAFLAGAAAFGRRRAGEPAWVRSVCIGGAVLDVLVNIFANGGIYGAVALSSIAFFGAGVAAGKNVPNRKKSIAELRQEVLAERLRKNAQSNTQSERRKRTRNLINEGFQEASRGSFPAARALLEQAMSALLQETPLDDDTTCKLAERMASPNLYIDVPSEQWLEWGETARNRKCFVAAVTLLEKGLTTEKNVSLARRALFSVGEIRIGKNMDPEEGAKRLKKVVELNGDDILAKQAKKMLEAYKPS